MDIQSGLMKRISTRALFIALPCSAHARQAGAVGILGHGCGTYSLKDRDNVCLTGEQAPTSQFLIEAGRDGCVTGPSPRGQP